MRFRIIYIFFILCLLVGISSCRSKRGPKEYIEKNGLHSDKKPHEIASELGSLTKKQKRAYKKELRERARKKKRKGYYGK